MSRLIAAVSCFVALLSAACTSGVVIAPPPVSPTVSQSTEAVTGGTTTIRTTCDKNGRCNVGVAGVRGPAQIICTEASQDPFNHGTPAGCSFWCNPNCGNGWLQLNQSGQTAGAGTITLNCSGQCPLACSLRITQN
jgi:hypothetical protein